MADFEAAVDRLSAITPRFSAVVECHGMPPLRHVEPGLQSLLRIVTDQLISLKAGEAMGATRGPVRWLHARSRSCGK